MSRVYIEWIWSVLHYSILITPSSYVNLVGIGTIFH